MRPVLKAILSLVLLLIAVSCPLPFQFSPSGWPGAASATDPSTPGITAAPVLRWSETSGAAGTLSDRQTASTSSDTLIELTSETVGAVIYYTTDVTTPDPRGSQTSRYAPGSPIPLKIESPTVGNSAASKTVTATAIGPNMKPSLVTSATVSLQYPQAAQPVFTPAPGGPTPNADSTVSLSTATPGASIYYTVGLSPADAPRPVPGQAGTSPYSAPIPITGPAKTWYISAIAVKSQMIDSTTASASFAVQWDGLAFPTFNPPSLGVFANSSSVTISSGAGSTIWYTLDGSAPVVNGGLPTYSMISGGTVNLTGGAPGTGAVMIRAVATQQGMVDSPERSASYTFRAATPIPNTSTFSPNNDFTLTLSTATAGAVIHYTTGALTPTDGSPPFPGSLVLDTPTTVNSIAVKAGYADSAVRSDTYSLTVGTPTFSLGGGPYPESLRITTSDLTAGALVHYTTDGSAPTIGSPTVQPILVMQTTTIKARAFRAGYLDSAESAVTYTLNSAFHTATRADILLQQANMTANPIPNLSTQRLLPGTMFTYKTSGDCLGKILIKNADVPVPVTGGGIRFDFVTYNLNGSVKSQGIDAECPGNFGFDLDTGTVNAGTGFEDFFMDWGIEALVPTGVPTALFAGREFDQIGRPEVVAADPFMSTSQIDNGAGSRLPVGEVILYQTGSGNYGKLVITNNNCDGNYGIFFKFTTFAVDGTVLATSTNAQCRGTWLFDLDAAPSGAEIGITGADDFWMENIISGTTMFYTPRSGARFTLGGVDPTP